MSSDVDTTPKAASEASRPTTPGDKPKPPPDPTRAEAFMFFAVIKHNKNKLDVDWSKVAEECNLKNGNTANARFRQIKQKLGFETPASDKGGKSATKVAKGSTVKHSATKSSGKKTPKKGGSVPSHVKHEEAEFAAGPLGYTPSDGGAASSELDPTTPTPAAKKRKYEAPPMPATQTDFTLFPDDPAAVVASMAAYDKARRDAENPFRSTSGYPPPPEIMRNLPGSKVKYEGWDNPFNN